MASHSNLRPVSVFSSRKRLFPKQISGSGRCSVAAALARGQRGKQPGGSGRARQATHASDSVAFRIGSLVVVTFQPWRAIPLLAPSSNSSGC